MQLFASNPPEVFLGKDLLKISSKFVGEHSCRSAVSIKLLCNSPTHLEITEFSNFLLQLTTNMGDFSINFILKGIMTF